MFCSLAAMGLNFKPLLDVCSLKIAGELQTAKFPELEWSNPVAKSLFCSPAENVHEFPFNRLLVVLKSCHELRYRNYSLFSAMSEYVVSTFDMWSNKQVRCPLV